MRKSVTRAEAKANFAAAYGGRLSAQEYLLLDTVGKLREPVRRALVFAKVHDMHYGQVAAAMKVSEAEAIALLCEAVRAVADATMPRLVDGVTGGTDGEA